MMRLLCRCSIQEATFQEELSFQSVRHFVRQRGNQSRFYWICVERWRREAKCVPLRLWSFIDEQTAALRLISSLLIYSAALTQFSSSTICPHDASHVSTTFSQLVHFTRRRFENVLQVSNLRQHTYGSGSKVTGGDFLMQ